MKPNNVANAIFAALMLLVLFQVAFSSEWAGSAQCSDYFSCTSCTAQDGCGWCAYLTECMPGTVNGSNSGWCTDFWSFWMFQPSECPAVGPIPSKCTSMPCSECVASTYCGWCGSSCVPGTANGPYYGSCPSWYFSACPVVLAKTVWWLWAMFGFLLFSLLVTVREAQWARQNLGLVIQPSILLLGCIN
jgi:hypothetical protein